MSNTQTIPYYLYTNGKLKKVEREKPDQSKYVHPGAFQDHSGIYRDYINSLPSIEVHEDLKKVWKELQVFYEGKDFKLDPVYDPHGQPHDVLGFMAIPLPVEAERTYPFTAKQISDLFEAGFIRGRESLKTFHPTAPDKAAYLKEHYGIDL